MDRSAPTSPSPTLFLFGDDGDDYAQVLTSRRFDFPRDHGSHPDYQTEWWYFTGNLSGIDERHFGFQLTFFRFALAPRATQRESAWATNQAWMAHLAITDTTGRQFTAEERFSREAQGLAGSALEPFRVWVEDWSAEGEGEEGLPMRLQAQTDRAELRLILTPRKPPVSHGDGGMDRKGPELGNASHYYSLTRLEATGTLRLDRSEQQVQGTAWMDREWGSSALSADVVGWDWFGLQLSDGRDLMFYRLRNDDGTSSPYSEGSLVDRDGSRRRLTGRDLSLQVLDYWRSPTSGARYPVGWELILSEEDLRLQIKPHLVQQELDLSVRYWEGAVEVTGRHAGQDITGDGYVELVGY